jgi:hypothetical protein
VAAGDGCVGQIAICVDDNSYSLATAFCEAFEISDPAMLERLASLIQTKINEHIGQLASEREAVRRQVFRDRARGTSTARRAAELEAQGLPAAPHGPGAGTLAATGAREGPTLAGSLAELRPRGPAARRAPPVASPYQLRTEAVRTRRESQRPLVRLELTVAPGKKGTIAVREGDNPHVLAANFCRVFNLRPEKQVELVGRIQEAVARVMIERSR